MADRVLVWHIEPVKGGASDPQGPIFILDRDYDPIRWLGALKCAVANSSEAFEFDIKCAGTTIFDVRPTIAKDEPELLIEEGAEGFAEGLSLPKDASMACYILTTGGAGGITISLELEALEDE